MHRKKDCSNAITIEREKKEARKGPEEGPTLGEAVDSPPLEVSQKKR